MAEPAIPLDSCIIANLIRPGLRSKLAGLKVCAETGSTNRDLLGLSGPDLHGQVLLAEMQTAGEGRRGRVWRTSPGNISMSIGWHFPRSGAGLGSLSLVTGVCICRALARTGLVGHGIKWPNDIVVGGSKLGGILVETRQRQSAFDAVIGIGINVQLEPESVAGIEQPWTDLSRETGLETLDRNTISALILEEVVQTFQRTESDLENFFLQEWPKWDTLTGLQIRVASNHGIFEGLTSGIRSDGALQLSVPDSEEPMCFHVGEVSVRYG